MLKLKRLFIEDAGPIEKLAIDFPLNEAGNPKPLILVGENGSGKTTALSFVVDALLQLAAEKFADVLTAQNMGNLFFRLRSHDVRLGASSSIAHVNFELDNSNLDYIDRVGEQTDANAFREKLNLPANFPINIELKSEKSITSDLGEIVNTFNKGAYLFFPSGRREIPHWFQTKALHQEHYTTTQKFSGRANKPFVIESAAEETATWIMDGLVDSSVGYANNGLSIANSILRQILQDSSVHFAIAPRHVWPRIQIYHAVDNDGEITRKMLIPSLGHLSAGQSMLLSMFSTIANHGTLYQQIETNQIEGVVVIDEAEVYLHTNLQRTVLPNLLKQFPKIQFIITTHSPSFLMGMKDAYGSENFQIINMPKGQTIDVNQFDEIAEAIDALKETSAFKNEIKKQVLLQNEQPLLIVEGKSDAILIKNFWVHEYGEEPPFNIMNAKGRRKLRYLLEDEEFIEEVGEHQRVFALFDFDEAYDDWNGCGKSYNITEDSTNLNLLKCHEKKKVFVSLLPVPEFRVRQAQEDYGSKSVLTIELYFPDEILSAGNNLDSVLFPGGVSVNKFRGDKVAFAERMSQRSDLKEYFKDLLALIKKCLID